MAYSSILEGLGGRFNASSVGNVPVDMREADAVTFFVYKSAGDQTVTLKESKGDDDSQNLAVIETVRSKASAGGTWAVTSQSAAAVYAHSDATRNVVAITVTSAELSPGFTHVTVESSGSDVLVVTHRLRAPRLPDRLRPDTTGTEPSGPVTNYLLINSSDSVLVNATDRRIHS